MCSQGISQFYLHTQHSSANGMNHTCLCLPSQNWYSFTDPGGMEAELAEGGWLVTYRNKCLAPGTKPGTVAHLSTNWARCRLTSLIEANMLTTMPGHHSTQCVTVP